MRSGWAYCRRSQTKPSRSHAAKGKKTVVPDTFLHLGKVRKREGRAVYYLRMDKVDEAAEVFKHIAECFPEGLRWPQSSEDTASFLEQLVEPLQASLQMVEEGAYNVKCALRKIAWRLAAWQGDTMLDSCSMKQLRIMTPDEANVFFTFSGAVGRTTYAGDVWDVSRRCDMLVLLSAGHGRGRFASVAGVVFQLRVLGSGRGGSSRAGCQ